MNTIDIKNLTNEERGFLVCLFFAQLRSDDSRYCEKCFSSLRTVSEKYGFKYNTLRNYKDGYDAIFDNGRAGWHQTPLKERNKAQYKFYEKYKDYPLSILESAVNEILDEAQTEGAPYFSIKTKNNNTVSAILSKEKNIEFDGLNILQDALKVGQPIFIVFGGDRPTWKTGLAGMGIISEEPYDQGYSGRNFKIKVDIKLLLDKPIKRDDLTPYRDTYGIIGIGPITKWEPNQAISQISEKSAVALMRAMLELSPNIESDLEKLIDEQTMQRIKGSTTMFLPVEVNYKEDIVDCIQDISKHLHDDSEEAAEPYLKSDFLNEVFLSEADYDTLCNLLERKKNIIFEGPPGVGKTFAAKRFAFSVLGKKYKSCIKMVQFHQSYSYEDFVMGFRPTETGFTLSEGPFYKFCLKAHKDKRKHFFIIDEINRGNLSKIFGELLMLIESDKRNETVNILYKNEEFSIPENLYIIGMMNTADRSLALFDYALRRRFGFYEMQPAFDSPKFREKISDASANTAKMLNVINELNQAICDDDTLGDGFRIGHSYFCCDEPLTDQILKMIAEYEIIPLLKEYWFDEPSKTEPWIARLRGVVE